MRKELDIHFDEESAAWFGKSAPIDRSEMEKRVWRFRDLIPSPRAFLDCTLPGHVRTLYSALGHGSDEEQLEGTAVEQAENYHIDFVKAAPQNGAALHSHGSEETFIALTGKWEVFWGDDGTGGNTVLAPFDGIVVPGGVLRGFRNIAEEEATLMTILGAHNAGHCIWAETLQPAFAKQAAEQRQRDLLPISPSNPEKSSLLHLWPKSGRGITLTHSGPSAR